MRKLLRLFQDARKRFTYDPWSDLQRSVYPSGLPTVSAYLRSYCCDAPVIDECSLRAFEEDRIYLTCARCRLILDYSDGEARWLLDRYANDEFVITQTILNIDPDAWKFHPRGTIEERNAWNRIRYEIQLHERMSVGYADLRNVNPF